MPIAYLLALLQMPIAMAATARPQCSAAGLTNNCEIFQKYGKKAAIPLSDGSTLQNPLLAPMQGGDPEDGDGPPPTGAQQANQMTPLRAKDMQIQARMIELWSKMPAAARVSPEFAADLNAIQPVPDKLLEWAGRRLVYPPGMKPTATNQISIVWPPSNTEGQRQTISVDKLVEFMNKIPTPYKQKMKALLQQRADNKVEALNTGENLSFGTLSGGPPLGELQKLFDYAKQTMLDEILKGRDLGSLRGAELSAYDRIRTVQFGGISPQNRACARVGNPAGYSAESHNFVFCPMSGNFPKAQLLKIIAHEMAHSIGPCISESPLVRINWNAIAKLDASPAHIPKAIVADRDVSQLLVAISQTPDRSPYAVLTISSMLKDQGAIARAQKLGLLEVVGPAMSEAENPSTPVITCLRDKEKVRDIGEKELDTIAKHFVEGFKNTTGKKQQSSVEEIKNRVRPFARCLETGTNHMLEAIPDAWSAKVMGKWLSENPPKTEIDKVAPFAYDLPAVCGPITNAPDKVASLSVEDIKQIAITDMNEVHPSNRVRMDKLALTEPRIQKALGCEPIPNANCLTLIGTNGDVAARKAAPTKPATNSKVNE